MAGDNSEQIADWNGALGQRWASLQEETDRIVGAFGDAAMRAGRPSAGERILDIGCGCGETTLALARLVGPLGEVIGVDVSAPMLAVAQARAREAGLATVSFLEADASNAPLPKACDLLYSRFGVMFFSAPVPAFVHLRGALRPEGRLSFVCWRAPRENPWAMAPLAAARAALGLTGGASDPHAPGPFAFADETRVRAILLEAGFRNVEAEAVEAPVRLGASPRLAAESASRIGPLSRLLRETPEDRHQDVIAAVELALAPLAQSDGSVAPRGSAWVITALAG
jgi:SAM-dependent methyltransferase